MRRFSAILAIVTAVALPVLFVGVVQEPGTLHAQVSPTDLFLTDTIVWNQSAGADSYDLSMVLTGGTPGVNEIGALSAFVPSDPANPSVSAGSLIGAATDNSVYDIFIRGRNANGGGDWSDAFVIRARLAPPKVTGVGKQ